MHSFSGLLQRTREHDMPSDEFIRHVDEEIVPFVEHTHDVRLTTDPARRLIMGQQRASSVHLVVLLPRTLFRARPHR